jgi:hypothetical protein
LSVTVIAPVRDAIAVGVKVTEIVHVPATVTEVPQVLVWLKSPLATIVAIVSAAEPEFVNVTTWAALGVLTGWFPKVRLVGAKLTAGAVIPVPLSATVCGLPVALSVTEIEPVRDPAAVGAKVTEIVQFADTATEEPHVLVWLKSPLAAMLLIVSAAEPVLDNVSVWGALVVLRAWLLKVTVDGAKLMRGAATPVPVNETICGLPLALSVTEMEPVRDPAAVGVKVTEIVQVPAAATEVPQVFAWLKSPLGAMLLIVKGAVPVLVSVTVWAALVVVMTWLAKIRLVGEKLVDGAVPVPVNETACGLPLALSVTEIEPVRKPVAVGVKLTEIVHVPATATEVPQVLVWLKSPLAAIVVIVKGAVPELVSVTDCAALVVPTAWLLKVKLVGETLTAGAVPVPVNETVCGLLLALSVTEIDPVRDPVAVGAKVTEIVQVPATATDEPQVLVWLKSPLAAIVVIVSVADPEFVSVTVWAALVVVSGWLPKLRLVGEKLTAGAVVPVPVSETVCGLPVALSVIETAPVRDPAAVGVKVTEIVQVPADATEAPHVLVWLKSPLAAMLVMARAAVPVLVSVTDCAALAVFRTWFPKLKLVGARLTAGAVPVPASETVCGLPVALSVTVTEPVRDPVAVGVNFTEMVQFAATATELPQVLVWLKSPLAAILAIVSVADPVFVSVTDCAALAVFNNWLPKLRLVGEKLTAGAVVPVPVNEAVWGLPGALSFTESVPVPGPAIVGVKVTEMVQVPAAATEPPHVFVWLKSPLAPILLIERVADPVLVSVMVWGALALRSNWFPKLRLVGDRLMPGPVSPRKVPLLKLFWPPVRLKTWPETLVVPLNEMLRLWLCLTSNTPENALALLKLTSKPPVK